MTVRFSRPMRFPRDRMTARSIVLLEFPDLPGQEYRRSASRASSVNPWTVRWLARAKNARRRSDNGSISSGRSRRGGDENRDDVQPIEKICPESALSDGRFQVDTRGGDDTDVGLACSAVADTSYSRSSMNRRSFGSRDARGDLRFVQEQRPPIADGRPARVVPDRPR